MIKTKPISNSMSSMYLVSSQVTFTASANTVCAHSVTLIVTVYAYPFLVYEIVKSWYECDIVFIT